MTKNDHLFELFGDRTAPDGSLVRDNFAKWFAGSKVVDVNGSPLVVYHGTPNPGFSVFRFGGEVMRHPSSALGVYFTESLDFAGKFAGPSGEIIPVHLAISNPYDLKWGEFRRMFAPRGSEKFEPGTSRWEDISNRALESVENLIEMGYDGIKLLPPQKPKGDEWSTVSWIALKPGQIKSAVNNCGAYSLNDPDINDSKAALLANALRAKHLVEFELDSDKRRHFSAR